MIFQIDVFHKYTVHYFELAYTVSNLQVPSKVTVYIVTLKSNNYLLRTEIPYLLSSAIVSQQWRDNIDLALAQCVAAWVRSYPRRRRRRVIRIRGWSLLMSWKWNALMLMFVHTTWTSTYIQRGKKWVKHNCFSDKNQNMDRACYPVGDLMYLNKRTTRAVKNVGLV